MRHLYLFLCAAGLSFFTYAQQHGMTLMQGADSLAQHSTGQRHPGGGTSSVSHK